MTRNIFLLLSTFLISLFGKEIDLSPFLRKIDTSLSPSNLPGIDCIYVVNLAERPGRWERMTELLSEAHLQGNRFDAINGWNLKNNKELRKQTRFGARYRKIPKSHLTWGGIGCFLSHLSVLKDAKERGFERIWILEDDIVIKKEPLCLPSILNELDTLDPEWDILYTDPNNFDAQGNYRIACEPLTPPYPLIRKDLAHYSKKEILNETLMRIYYRGGTYSMIISKKGIQQIYQALIHLPILIPYDDTLHFIEGIVEYASRFPIVTHSFSQPPLPKGRGL